MKHAFWILLALLVLSVALNVGLLTRPEPEPTIEHDTLWKDTTIYQPLPAETIDIGKTTYIKVPVPKYLPGDTVHDSIEVPIPIIQKRYDDSLYTAWVSGYDPALDSIRIYHPEIIITKTIVKPAPRLQIGIQAGAGIGIISRTPDIYVGIGAQYNLFKK